MLFEEERKRKVVLIDWGVFVHRSIFGWVKRKDIPATYTCFNSIYCNLRDVGIEPDDLVIIAVDSFKGNWRKDLEPAYKANRRTNREQNEAIDWKWHFEQMNLLLENIKESTPFTVIQIDKLEADDIISYACRHFKDDECIIVSTDSDFEQLYAFDNVKQYSPVSKKYKEVKNPYKVLATKIKKEAADNLITPVSTEIEYNLRKKIVNLIELPEEIDAMIKPHIDGLDIKENFDIGKIKFNGIRKKFMSIYGNGKKVVYSGKTKKTNKRSRHSQEVLDL